MQQDLVRGLALGNLENCLNDLKALRFFISVQSRSVLTNTILEEEYEVSKVF